MLWIFCCERYAKKYDAYLVFDADNLVAPDYIQEINKTFSTGYDIVTSYRNTKNYGDNWISAGYGLWFLREAQYLNRPRASIGASCGVSGTGFLFSARILQKCGGWHFFSLTEDIEFTAHNIVNGEKKSAIAPVPSFMMSSPPASGSPSGREPGGYRDIYRCCTGTAAR